MILQETNNLPVAAPQLSNMPAALVAFRAWRGNSALQMADFILYMQNANTDKTEFYNTLSNEITIQSGRFVFQKLS